MSRSRSLIAIPVVQKALMLAALGSVLIVLLAVMTGNFVPLMTSELGEFGVCENAERLEPVSHIAAGTETIYICGELTGETKRHVSFGIYHDSKRVFSRGASPALRPGDFFIPVHASELRYLDVNAFPDGSYQLQAAYQRDPVFFVEFWVESEP